MYSLIETHLFTRQVGMYLSDDDYASLYPTNVADNIPPHVLGKIRRELDDE